jgi:carbamoyl-phosphate synthase large subunit
MPAFSLCPKRTDLSTILIIGSGPIVIGQACEFDYSGAQACKALRQEGYRVVLVNSNPATIMTDPETGRRHLHRAADGRCARKDHRPRATRRAAAHRRRADRPQPGRGAGGTGGVLDRYGVELIGANLRAMQVAEDRELFKDAMTAYGLESPAAASPARWRKRAASPRRSGAIRSLSAPALRLGGSGAALSSRRRSSTRRWRGGCGKPGAYRAGRRIAHRLEGVRAGGDARRAPTTSWWSAPSRTWMRWACTPATASPWRRRRR